MVQVIDPVLGYLWFVPEEPYREEPGDRVSNKALREEFLRQQEAFRLTATEVAAAAGWYRCHGSRRPDAQRVNRTLGLECDSHRSQPRKEVTYHVAVQLAQALDMAPYEAGV